MALASARMAAADARVACSSRQQQLHSLRLRSKSRGCRHSCRRLVPFSCVSKESKSRGARFAEPLEPDDDAVEEAIPDDGQHPIYNGKRIELSDLSVGDRLDGVIFAQDYYHGLFVDIRARYYGNAFISEEDWQAYPEMKNAVYIGEKVKVEVVRINTAPFVERFRFPLEVRVLDPALPVAQFRTTPPIYVREDEEGVPEEPYMIKRTVPGREDMPAVEPPPYYVPEGVRRREEKIDDEEEFKKHIEHINKKYEDEMAELVAKDEYTPPRPFVENGQERPDLTPDNFLDQIRSENSGTK